MNLQCSSYVERHSTGGTTHTPNILTTTTPCVRALSRRAKLPLLSVEQAHARFMGPGAPKDVLAMLCVLGDWNPVCARLETQQLQAGLWELKQEAAANSGSDAAHIQVGNGVGTGQECQMRADVSSVQWEGLPWGSVPHSTVSAMNNGCDGCWQPCYLLPTGAEGSRSNPAAAAAAAAAAPPPLNHHRCSRWMPQKTVRCRSATGSSRSPCS
jgi:hypothetical protein